MAYRDLSEVDILDGAEALAERDPQGARLRSLRRLDRRPGRLPSAGAELLSLSPWQQPELSPADVHPASAREGATPAGSSSTPAARWPGRIDPDPLAGFCGSTADGFRNALAAWNAESHTPIRLVLDGTSGLTAGFTTFDRQNVLLFEDPNGDIEDDFSCSTGGTLAIGGPWFDPDVTGRFNGQTFIRIQGADIVLNDGIGCLFERSANPGKAFEELIGHETGHTLGLGHASENAGETNQTLRDALMYFRIHNDGRGARLASDDIAGLRTLYDRTFSGGGGGGGTGGCPAGTLCLVGGRFQVSATWSNQFDGRSGTAGAIKNTDVAGFLYFTDPGNIELIVKVLDFGDRVLFFYGQLTNLRFTISVLDTTTGVTKTYQNTAGECGGLDNNLATSSLVFETGPRDAEAGILRNGSLPEHRQRGLPGERPLPAGARLARTSSTRRAAAASARSSPT